MPIARDLHTQARFNREEGIPKQMRQWGASVHSRGPGTTHNHTFHFRLIIALGFTDPRCVFYCLEEI